MVSHEIQRVEELRLEKSLEATIADLLRTTFQTDFQGRSFFQNRHHCRFLVWTDEILAGHLAVAYRAIQVGKARTDIIGIGEVAVAPQFQNRGIGSALLKAALEEGNRAGAEFALLFGEASIYAKAGFTSANNPVTLSEREGARTGAITRGHNPFLMVRPLAQKQWPPHIPIDLAGFAF